MIFVIIFNCLWNIFGVLFFFVCFVNVDIIIIVVNNCCEIELCSLWVN